MGALVGGTETSATADTPVPNRHTGVQQGHQQGHQCPADTPADTPVPSRHTSVQQGHQCPAGTAAAAAAEILSEPDRF